MGSTTSFLVEPSQACILIATSDIVSCSTADDVCTCMRERCIYDDSERPSCDL